MFFCEVYNNHQYLCEKTYNMKKIIYVFFAVLSICSCNKERIAPDAVGYVSVDGERVMDLYYGVEQDVWGKHGWYLFSSQNNDWVDLNCCSVFIMAESDRPQSCPDYISISGVPGFPTLDLAFKKNGTKYSVFDASSGETNQKNLGKAQINCFNFNSSYSKLALDIQLQLTKNIHIYFKGDTQNDEINLVMD